MGIARPENGIARPIANLLEKRYAEPPGSARVTSNMVFTTLRLPRRYPDAALAIEKHFYMDDYLQALPDIETATRTIFEINEIHKAAAFQLRVGPATSPTHSSHREAEARAAESASGDHTERTLGLMKTKTTR
ncbi:hypothetical protein EVAR_91885_1 [Eumeta japonica]|uniref:Uncharacterized protein n=1 Tax=Eumeta variegata TaxID=151549 RepID=A0A4C1TP22_EUMVA|nr:hypothetical protein EVAR_91885_1 [Eumeta japonica]